MKRSKHLKDPLILFLILILTAGISLAASGDDFGSDTDDLETTQSSDYDTELRSGFGDDTDDAGAETDSETDSTESDDAGTSRDGFGDDTDDAETTQTNNETDSDGDAGTSRDGFGDDTDDEGPDSKDGISVDDSDNESIDRDGFGDDTDDEGPSENNFGDDTDDEGSSQDGYGDEEDSEDSNEEEGSEENENEENNENDEDDESENEESEESDNSDSDGESTSYSPADIEIVQNNDSESNDSGSEETNESSVEIQSVDWPNSVRQGSSFQVCAEVSASETPEVTLLKNGVEVETVSQNGNNCFTTTLEQPGDHTLEIRAEIDGAQDSETATVNAYTLDSGTDNQATGDFEDSTSSNSGLLLVGLLAVIAIGAGIIYRYRGKNP